MIYKLDSNHREIVDAYLRLGCRVRENARGKSVDEGFPDLTVGVYVPAIDYGVIVLIEVKTEAGKLSAAQDDFFKEWNGFPVFVNTCVDDVVRTFTWVVSHYGSLVA